MQVPRVRRWCAEPPDADASAPEPLSCDPTRKFVRVLEERCDGLVSFEFSIGWPELAVELLLPRQAFAEFCTTHRVQRLDGAPRHHHPEETRG
jgi:phenol hydroxylase P0 protein